MELGINKNVDSTNEGERGFLLTGYRSTGFSELNQCMRIGDDDLLAPGFDPTIFFPSTERTADCVQGSP